MVAARTVLLASLLPSDTDREESRHVLSIHGIHGVRWMRRNELRSLPGKERGWEQPASDIPGHSATRPTSLTGLGSQKGAVLVRSESDREERLSLSAPQHCGAEKLVSRLASTE